MRVDAVVVADQAFVIVRSSMSRWLSVVSVASERRRKRNAIALLHVDRRRGRELDLSESQGRILELRMANAFRSASTPADPDDDAPP